MTLKSLVVIIVAVCRFAAGGVISLEGDPHPSFQHHQHYHHEPHHVSVASSFMHFHGPVEGPAFEVKVPYVVPHTSEHNHLHEEGVQDHHEEDHHGLHHGYTVDYVAHPKYKYSYGVEDHHTGDFHGQKESRDGSSVTGEYSVMEPGGRMRVVTYRADKDGFHAVVNHHGKNDHSGATYTHEAAPQHHQHHVHEEIQPDTSNHELQQYNGYDSNEGYN